MFKASVMRLEWSETDVLCMGIICISVCIPNCCCMSAFHKSTWRCYSSYSYMNCIFASLFLILRPLLSTAKVEFCAPLRLVWKNILTVCVCLFVRMFLFPFTAINPASFPSLFLSFLWFSLPYFLSFLLFLQFCFTFPSKPCLRINKDQFVCL
jgi:hypothetical protein